MKVFKFGGASIRNSAAITNISTLLKKYAGQQIVVVVSAMGKTTNNLEFVFQNQQKGEPWQTQLQQVMAYHNNICQELFDSSHQIFGQLSSLHQQLKSILQNPAYQPQQEAAPAFVYDQVVSFGEIISSTIVAALLNSKGLETTWADARLLVKTDATHREGKVNWQTTENKISQDVPNMLSKGLVLTQGFLGGAPNGATTTLGREGSDFTAAIFGTCLSAQEVVIWKDVPGVLNADPRRLANTTQFKELSYREAAELTYYGASVIHPKTIKPLADKNIPLYVRSFTNAEVPGTCIHGKGGQYTIPTIVFKANQCLLSFKVRDLSFIGSKHIKQLFDEIERLNIHVNLTQQSATSLSVLTDYHEAQTPQLIKRLQAQFNVFFNYGLELVTIKNYNQAIVDEVTNNKQVLLQQTTRRSARIVLEAASN